MIKVTRFDKSELWVNPHLIEFIEATPDTVITLTSGKKIVIKESDKEVIESIIKYRNRLNLSKKQEE